MILIKNIVHIVRKFHKFLLALSNSFCVLKHKSFISLLHFLLYYWKWVSVFYFRETFFRNLKIVDWYTFGSMNWFAVDMNITLKSLLNMTFHETYKWLFLWPKEFFLIDSSCKFIFFHMTSSDHKNSSWSNQAVNSSFSIWLLDLWTGLQLTWTSLWNLFWTWHFMKPTCDSSSDQKNSSWSIQAVNSSFSIWLPLTTRILLDRIKL